VLRSNIRVAKDRALLKGLRKIVAVAVAVGGCTGQIGGSGQRGPTGAAPGQAGGSGPSSVTGQSGGPGSSAGGSSGTAANPCLPGVISVGDSPMQRLTQAQYGNSVRALLGLKSVATNNIPANEKLGTFASNVSTFVTDLDVDQYTTSAETAATAALAQASWDTLVPCDHASLGDDACAALFVQTFGQRAYRRPLSATEVGRYTAQYKAFAAPASAAASTGGYDNGIRVVVETMLQSPNFLYRPEVGAINAVNGNAVPLTPFELASRLSFFLWNSTPDDQLLSAASANQLSDASALQAQAQRLLADPRARDTMQSFHQQWLDIETAAQLTKDQATYPAYSQAVASAMAAETVDFTDYVFRQGDGKLQTLLTASYTVAGDALLPIYGVTRAAGANASGPLQLDGTKRAGILTQTAFLAVHAHQNQSGPVQRGRTIRQNVLCEPVPDPPPNVNTAPPDPTPNATTRQRFATHESVPSCAACHQLMDKIGFGLEGFDGIGEQRAMDGTQPVDVSGAFVGTQDLDGSFNGPVELANKLAASPEVRACVTSQWFSYALGRAHTADDACSLSRLVTSFNASGQSLKQLLVDIVTADSFRYRNLSTAGGTP